MSCVTDKLPCHAKISRLQWRLCKAFALSPSLLSTSSPMQASSAQILTQTLAQTRDGHGQSSPCTSPTSITPLPRLATHCKQAHLPRNPLCSPGYWIEALGTGWIWWHLGDCLLFPEGLQTDPEQDWSDIPRCRSRRLLCLPEGVLEVQRNLTSMTWMPKKMLSAEGSQHKKVKNHQICKAFTCTGSKLLLWAMLWLCQLMYRRIWTARIQGHKIKWKKRFQ